MLANYLRLWYSSHRYIFLTLDMLQKDNSIDIKYKNVTNMNTIKLDKNLLDFIFQFCSVMIFLKIGSETFTNNLTGCDLLL
jgi:hypothetical protein